MAHNNNFELEAESHLTYIEFTDFTREILRIFFSPLVKPGNINNLRRTLENMVENGNTS